MNPWELLATLSGWLLAGIVAVFAVLIIVGLVLSVVRAIGKRGKRGSEPSKDELRIAREFAQTRYLSDVMFNDVKEAAFMEGFMWSHVGSKQKKK